MNLQARLAGDERWLDYGDKRGIRDVVEELADQQAEDLKPTRDVEVRFSENPDVIWRLRPRRLVSYEIVGLRGGMDDVQTYADTSLAASIERMEKLKYSKCSTGDKECDCANCDQKRILEAAKKWEATCRGTAKMLAAQANDPDGVGEGWRLLKRHEVIVAGDQMEDCRGEWSDSDRCGEHAGWAIRYRRRIDADCVTREEGYGNVCERGTANCPGEHDDIGESEAGRRYQERTEACVGRQRREWWFDGGILGHPHTSHANAAALNNGVLHVREVLPGDPDQEWVDELIRIAEVFGSLGDQPASRANQDRFFTSYDELVAHLKKRGEK